MKLTDFDALSFDCYGTLIDWEAGLAAVLGPWARARGLQLDDETLLAAYSAHEARAEAEYPGESYPDDSRPQPARARAPVRCGSHRRRRAAARQLGARLAGFPGFPAPRSPR